MPRAADGPPRIPCTSHRAAGSFVNAAYGNSMNSPAMMIVGRRAPASKPPGAIPSLPNAGAKIDCPAGFGAFAITVKPPPLIAPAITAYFSDGENPGTEKNRPAAARATALCSGAGWSLP